MGKGSIDLGLPTEDKPEWTISLDFAETKTEEPTDWTISQDSENTPAQETASTPEPSFSSQDSSPALDSGFLLDGNISPAGSQNAGGTGGISGALDGGISSAGDAVLGGGTEMPDAGGISGALDGNISSAGDAVLGGGTEMLGESDTMIQMPQRQEDPSATLGEDTIVDSPGLSDVTLDTPVQAPAEEMVNHVEAVPEPVEQPVQSVQPATSDDLENDEVDERLSQMAQANSMDGWEQSEKALSEAAAMLSAERRKMEAQNESDLKNLFDRLDISENLDRMNAAVQEDLADVIEQTKQDELLEAKSAMSVEENTASPDPDVEISNDMFDLGVDLSDDDNFSDENIDLSSFKGSIEDADEINKPSENSIDLDETETTADSLNSGLDMSNLVAAALNNLAGNTENPETASQEPAMELEPEMEPEMEPVEEDSSLTFDTGVEPETNEGNLEFAIEEEESQPEAELADSSLTFDTGAEPETNEGSLEFAIGEEESQPEAELTESSPEFDSGSESGLQGAIEFAAAPEPESPSEVNTEESIPEFVAAPETEEMNLNFEPVYPEGEDTPTVSNVIDDIAGDDIASMIIEDYSEVPTVSAIENKLNKQEKEKKRGKSKESHQNKEDGFAYSLDDISTEEEISRNPVVEAALEVAADTLANQEVAASGEPTQVKRRVSTQHVVYKNGKLKRSYYKLFYV